MPLRAGRSADDGDLHSPGPSQNTWTNSRTRNNVFDSHLLEASNVPCPSDPTITNDNETKHALTGKISHKSREGKMKPSHNPPRKPHHPPR